MDVSGSAFAVSDYVNALGTWMGSRSYELTDGYAFEPEGGFKIDMDGPEPLKTIVKLPVELLKNGTYKSAVLDAGTEIYPVSTDAETYMNFRLGDGTEGRITFTITNYECMIDGMSEFDCFEDLPYAG